MLGITIVKESIKLAASIGTGHMIGNLASGLISESASKLVKVGAVITVISVSYAAGIGISALLERQMNAVIEVFKTDVKSELEKESDNEEA